MSDPTCVTPTRLGNSEPREQRDSPSVVLPDEANLILPPPQPAASSSAIAPSPPAPPPAPPVRDLAAIQSEEKVFAAAPALQTGAALFAVTPPPSSTNNNNNNSINGDVSPSCVSLGTTNPLTAPPEVIDDQSRRENNQQTEQEDQQQQLQLDPEASCNYNFNHTGLAVACCGYTFRVHPLSILVRVCLLVFIWLCLWLLITPQSLLEPRGEVFDPIVTLVVASVIGKLLGEALGIPPLILIFLAGFMWGNVPRFNHLTSGITGTTRGIVGKIGLANILLRTGLAVTPQMVRPAALNIIAMSIFPLAVETLVHGFMASSIYDYGSDKLWPFLQAMVVAPSASGVVAAVVMAVQQRGYTKRGGPGVLLIPACAIDMTLGIWGVSFMEQLLTRDSGASLVWPILKGPVQIIAGAIVGMLLALVWYGAVLVLFSEGQPIPAADSNDRNNVAFLSGAFVQRVGFHASVLLGLFACFTIFLGHHIDWLGGGCIACTLVGATAQYLVTRDAPPPAESTKDSDNNDNNNNNNNDNNAPPADYSSPPEHRYIRGVLVHNFAITWDYLVMPAVFSFSAAALDAGIVFDTSTLGLALGVIFVGFIARSIATYFCIATFPLRNWQEYVITAMCLGGKAFAQVAMGGPTVRSVFKKNSDAGQTISADELRYGNYVKSAGALSVIFISPIVVVMLSVVLPLCTHTDDEWDEIDRKEKEAKLLLEEKKKNEEEEQQQNHNVSTQQNSFDNNHGDENHHSQEDEEMQTQAGGGAASN